MPEYPEMEHYRQLLSERIVGQQIVGTEVTRDKSINLSPEEFRQRLFGRSVWFVERRGKHLLFHLDNGERLLLHLMLGGWLFFGTEDQRPERTVQVILSFPNGNLYFIGLRLGYLHLMSAKEADERLSGLGPEPFDRRLTVERFRERFKGKRGTLKTALVDQRVIAGIGNCYADEIAYEAALRPDAKVSDMTQESFERLYAGMHTMLQEAVSKGGYMEHPLFSDDEQTGGYNDECKVYDRTGEKCYRCGGTIEQHELSSRKAYFCPGCQKER